MDPQARQPIAAPAASEHMLRETLSLARDGRLLASQGKLDAYLADAESIPAILHEIGRLRETTFRAVGEGTGKPLDLDRFDETYQHLFLWDREASRVAGGYRIGLTDDLLALGGSRALYTSTLFEFERPFLDHLSPALELGRSFVAADYQRGIHPLALLWRGIGAVIAQNPRHCRLFGPVSISNDYSALSRDLIVSFMSNTCRNGALADWAHPLRPYAASDISAKFDSIEEVSAAVTCVEPDGKGIPVLLRQYLKLNATLIGFNVDPDFGGCLDALLLVDMREAPATQAIRYLGEAGYQAIMGTTAEVA